MLRFDLVIALSLYLVPIASVAQDCEELCSREWWSAAGVEDLRAEVGTKGIMLQDIFGATPLHWAGAMGTPKMIGMILQAGADIDSRDGFGSAPLHFAAERGTPNNIATLVSAGANIEAADNKSATPLHRAAAKGSAVNVSELLRLGASFTVGDEGGKTPCITPCARRIPRT